MLNSMAVQILLTENPSINLSANNIISALITNKNKPKVTMVIGKVKIIKIGFSNTFKMANTKATTTAFTKTSPDKVIPGIKYAKINTAKAVKRSLRIIFMILRFNKSTKLITKQSSSQPQKNL